MYTLNIKKTAPNGKKGRARERERLFHQRNQLGWWKRSRLKCNEVKHAFLCLSIPFFARDFFLCLFFLFYIFFYNNNFHISFHIYSLFVFAKSLAAVAVAAKNTSISILSWIFHANFSFFVYKCFFFATWRSHSFFLCVWMETSPVAFSCCLFFAFIAAHSTKYACF